MGEPEIGYRPTPSVFTPEIIFEILRRAIKDADARIPNKNDPAITSLALQLYVVESHFRFREALICREMKQYKRVRDAIDVLVELLPDIKKARMEAYDRYPISGRDD